MESDRRFFALPVNAQDDSVCCEGEGGGNGASDEDGEADVTEQKTEDQVRPDIPREVVRKPLHQPPKGFNFQVSLSRGLYYGRIRIQNVIDSETWIEEYLIFCSVICNASNLPPICLFSFIIRFYLKCQPSCIGCWIFRTFDLNDSLVSSSFWSRSTDFSTAASVTSVGRVPMCGASLELVR